MNSTIRTSISTLVPLLERLSLLRINSQALDRVVRTVEFATATINEIDDDQLKDVAPMISPTSEHQTLYMRNDHTETPDRQAITKNAVKMIEDYFVTPSKHRHYSQL